MPKMKYNQLRTLAFRLHPDITELPHRCNALDFPERWKQPLRELQASLNKGRKSDKVQFPIARLNRVLRALIPDLLSIEVGAGKSGERPWLYAARVIEPVRLMPIVHAWVNTAFPGASIAARQQVLQELITTDLVWRTDEALNLATWRAGANGTAEAARNDAFVLLPDKLASMISHPDVHLEYGPTGLRFLRAPLSLGQKGAELVSWPPIPYSTSRHTWYYSVVITLTVQTVPFQAFPTIHCDVGLRRWAGMGNRPPEGNTSVYLLTNVPWLRGLHETSSFQVASIRWQANRPALSGGKTTFTPIWGDYLVEILNLLHPQRPFPDPQALLDDPIQALNLEGSPTAAMVFRPGMDPEHGVGPGLMPPDRRSLAEQLATMIAPTLEFTTPPERVAYKTSSTKNPFFVNVKDKKRRDGSTISAVDSATRDAAFAQRRAQVRQVVGERLNIEIWHDTTAMRDALIASVCDEFGLTPSTELPARWKEPEIEIELAAYEVGKLASALEIDSGIKDERDRLRTAINQRVNEITVAVPPAHSGTIALIEMAGKEAFRSNVQSDPKAAIRIGFGRRGRLNQHFTPGDGEKLENKAKHGLLDALRQLGLHPDLPTVEGLPKPLGIVGVWLIKHTQSNSPSKTPVLLPVFVSMRTDAPVIKATAPGLGDTWLPYGEALLAIADGEAQGYGGDQQVRSYIQQTLSGDILAQGDTLFLCHAQNLRLTWPWLQNGRIMRDQVSFGYDEPVQPVTRWPGLRIVRVRSKTPFETPEWYAQSTDDEQGFTKGLFRMSERVLASTYNKPHQFKNLSPNLSKADAWTAPKSGKTFDASPDAYAWNPSLFELTVACLQPQDRGIDWPWAALTHELRELAPHYDQAIALPLPLHLGQLMEEYLVSLEDSQEE